MTVVFNDTMSTGTINSEQNQKTGVQFDSKDISANQSKRYSDIKFRTRLTLKDKLKKFFTMPLMRGPRKFLWMLSAFVVIAGIVVGTTLMLNLNTNKLEEGSDEWYSELNNEIEDGFADRDFDTTIKKIDGAIKNAKSKDDKDTARRLFSEKAYIYSNSGMNEEAIANYKEMLEYFGNETVIYSALANIQLNIGDKQSALKNYRNAIKYFTENDSDRGYLESQVELLVKELDTEQ